MFKLVMSKRFLLIDFSDFFYHLIGNECCTCFFFTLCYLQMSFYNLRGSLRFRSLHNEGIGMPFIPPSSDLALAETHWDDDDDKCHFASLSIDYVVM